MTCVCALLQMSHALNLTTIISLLQPPPEVFNLFDDLLLLASGKMLYHGPLEGALKHFTSMGFICPVRKDLASFLLEITTQAGGLTAKTLARVLVNAFCTHDFG